MEYTKLNVQVPFPFHSYIFHIPHQFIYLFVFVSGKRMKMAMAGMLFQWLIICPLWEVPPLTGPNGSSSMSFSFSFSNSKQNPCCNSERLVSKLYKFCFFVFCFCNRIIVIVALTLLTSSQSILIVWSKRNGKYNYSITASNFMVSIVIYINSINVSKYNLCLTFGLVGLRFKS